MGEKKGYFWLYLSVASILWVALYYFLVKWQGNDAMTTQSLPAQQKAVGGSVNSSGGEMVPVPERQTKSS